MIAPTKDFTDHHATPITSMRAKCLECMGYQPSEVLLCTAPKCPLFPYRKGKRPQGSKQIGLTEAIKLSKRW